MRILEFKPLTLEDIVTLRPFFERNLCRICDCTIGGTFLWRDYFDTQYAVCGDLVYFKVRYFTGETAFTSPHGRGEMTRAAIDRIVTYSEENGLKPLLCAVSESRLNMIQRYYPKLEAVTNRDWSDYLYKAETMKALSGRRLAGQRNHINRFLRSYPEHSFEAIGDANIEEARHFFEAYTRPVQDNAEVYYEGNSKALEVLSNYGIYGQVGGILRADGEIVGAAIGEIVGDTLFVHIEKARLEVPGAYQTLIKSFANMYATDGVMYINREEDDGIPGLRAAKESYHPIALLSKFVIEIKT